MSDYLTTEELRLRFTLDELVKELIRDRTKKTKSELIIKLSKVESAAKDLNDKIVLEFVRIYKKDLDLE